MENVLSVDGSYFNKTDATCYAARLFYDTSEPRKLL